MKDSQKKLILQYLIDGNSITGLEALSMFGCFRLADVIFRLKTDFGYNIKTEYVQINGKRFGKYTLIV